MGIFLRPIERFNLILSTDLEQVKINFNFIEKKHKQTDFDRINRNDWRWRDLTFFRGVDSGEKYGGQVSDKLFGLIESVSSAAHMNNSFSRGLIQMKSAKDDKKTNYLQIE